MSEDSQQLSVAELLARNGQGSSGSSGGRRRRAGRGISVADLTGDQPTVSPGGSSHAAPDAEPEPQAPPSGGGNGFDLAAYGLTPYGQDTGVPSAPGPSGYNPPDAPAYPPPGPASDLPSYSPVSGPIAYYDPLAGAPPAAPESGRRRRVRDEDEQPSFPMPQSGSGRRRRRRADDEPEETGAPPPSGIGLDTSESPRLSRAERRRAAEAAEASAAAQVEQESESARADEAARAAEAARAESTRAAEEAVRAARENARGHGARGINPAPRAGRPTEVTRITSFPSARRGRPEPDPGPFGSPEAPERESAPPRGAFGARPAFGAPGRNGAGEHEGGFGRNGADGFGPAPDPGAPPGRNGFPNGAPDPGRNGFGPAPGRNGFAPSGPDAGRNGANGFPGAPDQADAPGRNGADGFGPSGPNGAPDLGGAPGRGVNGFGPAGPNGAPDLGGAPGRGVNGFGPAGPNGAPDLGGAPGRNGFGPAGPNGVPGPYGPKPPEPDESPATAAWSLREETDSGPVPRTPAQPAKGLPAWSARRRQQPPPAEAAGPQTAAWMPQQEQPLVSGQTVAGDLLRNGEAERRAFDDDEYDEYDADFEGDRFETGEYDEYESGDYREDYDDEYESGEYESGRSKRGKGNRGKGSKVAVLGMAAGLSGFGRSLADKLPGRGGSPEPAMAGAGARSRLSEHELNRRQWMILGAQSAGAAVAGMLLFKGFERMWEMLPWVALALAMIVILGLVALVRVLRHTDDILSTVIAVVVGTFVTLGPLAFLLSTG